MLFNILIVIGILCLTGAVFHAGMYTERISNLIQDQRINKDH